MFTKSVRLSALTLALGICATAISAHATPLPPNTPATAVTAIANGTQGTPLVAFTTTVNATTFSATYTEIVYQGGANALCPTCLAFAVTVTNNTATDVIQALTMSFFSNYTAVADYVTGSGSVPSSVSRSQTGNAIAYNFGTGFGFSNGGITSTDQLIVFTNATQYNANGALALQDDSNVTGAGYMPVVPASVTPEPSSLVLLGTGLVGVAGLARRKFLGR